MASYFILSCAIAFAFLCNCCCQADLINQVCSKALYTDICNRTLRSDPRTNGKDLKGLGQIVIEKSQAAIGKFINVAKSVKDSKNKVLIETCIETQTDAIHLLNDCKKLLQEAHDAFSKSTLNTVASAALTNVETCDDEFGAAESPELKLASIDAEALIGVLLVISNVL